MLSRHDGTPPSHAASGIRPRDIPRFPAVKESGSIIFRMRTMGLNRGSRGSRGYGRRRFRIVAIWGTGKSGSECDDRYQIALCVMHGETSKDGSPAFIRVISEIRGLFTVNFELHNTCRDLELISLEPSIPCRTTLLHTLIYFCDRAPEPEIASEIMC